MAYKPLSQTLVNGKTAEIPSVDVVFNQLALKQNTLQSGVSIKTINGASLLGSGDISAASTSLSNLTAPTAVNQDLLLDAGKKIRLNASETVNTLLHVKSPAVTSLGINAIGPSNSGSTTFNTSASISAVLAVGDYIKLNGLSDIARITTINSSTQITVDVSLGIGGGGSNRDIEKVPTSATFRNSSNVEEFSIINGRIKFASNIILGSGAGDRVSTGVGNIILGNAGRAITTASTNILIGSNAGAAFVQGASAIAIGTNALAAGNANGTGNTGVVAIGMNALSSMTSVETNFGSGGAANVAIGFNAATTATAVNAAVILGHGAAANGSGTLDTVVYVGAACGRGGSRIIAIGRDTHNAYTTAGLANSTVVGHFSAQALTSGTNNSMFGFQVGATPTSGGYNCIFGSFSDTILNSTTNALVLGNSSKASTNNIAFGSSSYGYNTAYMGLGEVGAASQNDTSFKLTGHQATGTDVSMYGSVVVAGSAGTGTGIGSAVVLSTAPAAAGSSSTVNTHVQRVRIDQGGNVGVGVFNPESALEVSGKTSVRNGDLEVTTIGKGLKIATGTDATAGIATILNGQSSVTVTTAAATTNSIILVTNQLSTAAVCVTTKAAGSFKIEHANNVGADTPCAWFIINPMPVIDTDAQTFITAAGITNTTQIAAVDRLVKSLKDANIWTKMKAIYPFVGGTATAHKYNLKDPQDLDASYRIVFGASGVTHNSRGVQFSGMSGTAWADTKCAPNVAFSAINNFHISGYFYYDTLDWRGGPAIGADSSASAQRIWFNPDSAQANFNINGTTRSMRGNIQNFPTATRPYSNFMLMNSESSNVRGFLRSLDKDLYEVWDASGTAATGSLPTTSFVIGGYNNNGAPSQNWAYGTSGPKTMQTITIGDALTTLQVYTLHKIIEQFNLDLGRQV